jgi:hypothetical protein
LSGAFLLTTSWHGTAVQSPARKRPVVRQADHLQIASADPKDLFDLFTAKLELPVAWPFVDDEDYSSGGFGTGNFMVQVFRSGAATAAAGPHSARYTGLAFEPYSMSECLPELDARGMAHGPPQPFVGTRPDGTRGELWTTAALTGLAAGGMNILLYEYGPVFLNVHVRRNQLAGQLVLRKGGPLGVVAVGEVVITSAEPARDAQLWQRLLEPAQAVEPGLWKVGSGPAIRLIPGRSTKIERMTFVVDSLERARAFLRREKMIGAAAAGQLAINPARVQGLGIRLVETGGPQRSRDTR